MQGTRGIEIIARYSTRGQYLDRLPPVTVHSNIAIQQSFQFHFKNMIVNEIYALFEVGVHGGEGRFHRRPLPMHALLLP